MNQTYDFYPVGSVQARLLRSLVDEAMRALHDLLPVHWLFISAGGHWAVWMRSAAEPEFVIEFAVGNDAHPHEADTEEPEFIMYLPAPRSAIAAGLVSYLRAHGYMANPAPNGHVEWTLVDAFDGTMDLADEALKLHADRIATLRQQVIADLPRALAASVHSVLTHAELYASPGAMSHSHGSLH